MYVTLQACSYWHPYLSLVPNNENCGPPMVWSESDRERLLEGTGVNKLVDGDMEKMDHDFTSTVLPFMKRHSEIFRYGCDHQQCLDFHTIIFAEYLDL